MALPGRFEMRSYMPRRATAAPILYVWFSIIPRCPLKTWPATANTPVGYAPLVTDPKPANRLETEGAVL